MNARARTARIEALRARIRSLDGAVVALSGGVDSSLVAALASSALGPRALAVTAASPALATGELDEARAVAESVCIEHRAVQTAEMERGGYAANGPDRCYHCKSELYDVLLAIAGERGYAAVLSGTNADDLGDWRPGIRAAAERGVIHPLVEAGMGKAEVRELAAELGVPTARKPAAPCLASRLPYGTRVTEATLRQVDRAERAIKSLGFDELRVRHLGRVGRVELSRDGLLRAEREGLFGLMEAALRDAGYEEALVSRTPLRSGSLNDALRTRSTTARA